MSEGTQGAPGPSPDQGGDPVWQPPQGRRRNPAVVLLGVLLGLGLGFFVLPYAGVVIADGLVDTSSDGDWTIVTLAVVPLLLGIALLVPPRFRVVGAGVVMGLAVGLIVGSASCLGLIGLFAASYNA